MSTSRQFSESRAIPTRTVLINDTTQLPHDYCITPGGTLFSTTPGGKLVIRLPYNIYFLERRIISFLCCLCSSQTVMLTCRCGLGCLVISIKTKTKPSPAPVLPGCCLTGWFAAQRFWWMHCYLNPPKKRWKPTRGEKECENDYKQKLYISTVLYCFKYSQIAIYDSFQSI